MSDNRPKLRPVEEVADKVAALGWQAGEIEVVDPQPSDSIQAIRATIQADRRAVADLVRYRLKEFVLTAGFMPGELGGKLADCFDALNLDMDVAR